MAKLIARETCFFFIEASKHLICNFVSSAFRHCIYPQASLQHAATKHEHGNIRVEQNL